MIDLVIQDKRNYAARIISGTIPRTSKSKQIKFAIKMAFEKKLKKL